MRISDWSSDVCSSDLLELDATGIEGEIRIQRREPGNIDRRVAPAFRRGVGSTVTAGLAGLAGFRRLLLGRQRGIPVQLVDRQPRLAHRLGNGGVDGESTDESR